VATITLGSHTVIRYQPKQSSPTSQPVTLFLEKGSLAIVTQNLYEQYTHAIEPIHTDTIKKRDSIANAIICSQLDRTLPAEFPRGTRVSLTFRHVKNVVKPSTRLLNLLKSK